jgi:IS1 family transposase
MNQLPIEKQILVASLLVEGSSIRSISRITGVHKCTISNLAVRLGEKAQRILDETMININSKQIQLDEIWCFVGKKKKNLTEQDRQGSEFGDQWIFIALDADTKLVPFFAVGKRTSSMCIHVLEELKRRIITRFQLTTDSFNGYADAVDRVLYGNVDYAQIHKFYADTPEGQKRYSPANIIRVTKKMMLGNPKPEKISTSYVERQNLTMRMQMRRLTRLTNAFSKKLYNLQCAVALHFYYYNFMRVHQSLRITPAMEAGIAKSIHTWYDFLAINILRKVA